MRVLLMLLLFTACTIERRGAPGTDPDTELDIGGQTEEDSIVVEISSPRVASIGDSVPINLIVHNNRERNIDLSVTGREIVFDVVIARAADSTVVWQRLRNVVVQPILQIKPMAPGGSFTLSEKWAAREAGEFIIGAELPTDTKPLQAKPVRLTIR